MWDFDLVLLLKDLVKRTCRIQEKDSLIVSILILEVGCLVESKGGQPNAFRIGARGGARPLQPRASRHRQGGASCDHKFILAQNAPQNYNLTYEHDLAPAARHTPRQFWHDRTGHFQRSTKRHAFCGVA